MCFSFFFRIELISYISSTTVIPLPRFDNSPGFMIHTFFDSFFVDEFAFSALVSSFFSRLNYFENLANSGSRAPFLIWKVRGRVFQGFIPMA